MGRGWRPILCLVHAAPYIAVLVKEKRGICDRSVNRFVPILLGFGLGLYLGRRQNVHVLPYLEFIFFAIAQLMT